MSIDDRIIDYDPHGDEETYYCNFCGEEISDYSLLFHEGRYVFCLDCSRRLENEKEKWHQLCKYDSKLGIKFKSDPEEKIGVNRIRINPSLPVGKYNFIFNGLDILTDKQILIINLLKDNVNYKYEFLWDVYNDDYNRVSEFQIILKTIGMQLGFNGNVRLVDYNEKKGKVISISLIDHDMDLY